MKKPFDEMFINVIHSMKESESLRQLLTIVTKLVFSIAARIRSLSMTYLFISSSYICVPSLILILILKPSGKLLCSLTRMLRQIVSARVQSN
jgi:hypothetical protein